MEQATEQITSQYINASLNKKQWGSIGYNAIVEGVVEGGLTDTTAQLQTLVNKAITEGRRTIFLPHITNGQYRVTALTSADQVDFVGDNSSFVGGYTGTIGDLGGFAALEVDINQREINVKYPPAPLVGATGDDVTDDTAAINAIFAYAQSIQIQRTIAAGDVGSLSGDIVKIIFPVGVYLISNEINLGFYAHIEGELGTFIKQTDVTKDIFGSTVSGAYNGYYTMIRNIHFIGGKRQIVLERPNIDASMNLIENCQHSGGDESQPAIYIKNQSGINIIRRPRVLSRPYFLEIEVNDKCTVESGWINGYGESNKKPANSRSFKVTGMFTLKDCILVHEENGGVSSAAGTRWIDNYGRLLIDNCSFGAENAGFPIVYNFSNGANEPVQPYIGTGINIQNSTLAAGRSDRVDRGVIVLKTGVPSQMNIENCSYPSDSYYINSTQMVDGVGAAMTLATWIAANTNFHAPRLTIHIKGDIYHGILLDNLVPALLQKYAVIEIIGGDGVGNTIQLNELQILNELRILKQVSNQGSANAKRYWHILGEKVSGIVYNTMFNILSIAKTANVAGANNATFRGILKVNFAYADGVSAFVDTAEYLIAGIQSGTAAMSIQVKKILKNGVRSDGLVDITADIVTVQAKTGATSTTALIEAKIAPTAAALTSCAVSWEFEYDSLIDTVSANHFTITAV